MKTKVLLVATVTRHIQAFHLPYLQWLQEQGYETHVVTGDAGSGSLPYVDQHIHIPMSRSPLSLGNLAALFALRAVMQEHRYALVHCHTPVGGVVTRLAALGMRHSPKIVYTAHGFHFYRGAPWQNWLLYFPLELVLSWATDLLITINQEDYATAKRCGLAGGKVALVDGVGVDFTSFAPLSDLERNARRESYGYTPEQLLIFSAAEFNKNKNHIVLLLALAEIVKQHPDIKIKLLLAGDGELLTPLQKYVASSLGLADRVDFLGYRDDVAELLPMCDLVASASMREGLPVNIIEALACGLPVVASRVRGHVDLLQHGRNGMLVPLGLDSYQRFARSLRAVLRGIPGRRGTVARICRRSVAPYEVQNVMEQVTKLYTELLR